MAAFKDFLYSVEVTWSSFSSLLCSIGSCWTVSMYQRRIKEIFETFYHIVLAPRFFLNELTGKSKLFPLN